MTDDSVKHAVDAVSVATTVATLAGILPAIAALFTIVWTFIRIYESKTVQDYLRRKDG